MTPWRGRYLLLGFDCMLVMGLYFCTDIPSALQTQIEMQQSTNCTKSSNQSTCCEDCLGLGSRKYNLLFTILNWTSMIIMLPMGIIIDRLGNRVSALMFTGIATSGAFLFAAASLSSIRHTSAMFPIMMCGRLLLGFGGGARIVRDRVIACWFPDKLSLAFGIAQCTSGIGNVLTFLLTANIAQWIGLGPTLFVGAVVCSTCFLGAIGLYVLDWYGTSRYPSTVYTQKTYTGNICVAIKSFPKSFWLLALMIATYFSFELPFVGNGSKYFQQRYGYNKVHSSYLNGIIYDVSVVFSPFVGIILDKIGNRGWIAVIGATLTMPMGSVLLYTGIPVIAVLIWIGFMFTIVVVALWSSIPRLVPTATLGTANGIVGCLLDMFVGFTSLTVGHIMHDTHRHAYTDNETQWTGTFLLLFGLVTVCAVIGFILNLLANTSMNEKYQNVEYRSPSETDRLLPNRLPQINWNATM